MRRRKPKPKPKPKVKKIYKEKILYRSGYKHQLAETYSIDTPFRPEEAIELEFISLSASGRLTIKGGYAWDGPSGPTIDSPCSMRGALVHDAIYQLIRYGKLPASARDIGDSMALDIWREDGMSKLRSCIWYRSISRFAAFAADPKNKKVVKVAP